MSEIVRHKVDLQIPPSVSVGAWIRVVVRPAPGAVLIYNSALGARPVRAEGPFSVCDIPVETPELHIELVDGASEYSVETLGYAVDNGSIEGSRRKPVGPINNLETLSDEHKRFYSAIGFAISQWQHVEVALAHTFISLVQAGDQGAANSAYFAAINFSTKLDMVNAAAQMRIHSPLLDEWDSLYKEARSRSNVRNNLAHFMCVMRIYKNDKYRYYLEPNILNLSNLGAKSPRYNFLNIENEGRSFGEFAQRLMDFIPKLPQILPSA